MWTPKGDLITMSGADRAQVCAILDGAHTDAYPEDVCKGRSVANLFFEDSTRTRVSFSLAAGSLGATAIDLTAAGSSVSKGESMIDTACTIESMGFDAIVMRHQDDDAALRVSELVRCPLINAGAGRAQHPTQALGDALVIGESFGRNDRWDFSGLKIAIVGDVISSRVAGSNIDLLRILGAEVVLIGPEQMVPGSLSAEGCRVERDLDSVIEGVDALMMLRIQFERGAGSMIESQGAYQIGYQLNETRADRLKRGAIVMHPGPMNRGIEIAGAVADADRSKIRDQVHAGVRVRRAVIRHALD